MTVAIPVGAMLEHADLLGPFFEGVSWATWRAVAKAAFGEALSPAELEAFRKVADRDPPPGRVRTLCACAGRGAGKDAIASAICTALASTFDPAGLRPGERAVVQLVACDREQARIALNYIRAYFAEVPALAELIEWQTEWALGLRNRVDVEVTTNSHRTTRGRSLLAVVMDEAAFYRTGDNTASSDAELYTAVRPGLARVRGSMLVVISSVYRRAGLLHDLHKRYHGTQAPDVLVVHGGTRDFNPTFPQAEIEAALAEDRQAAAAEYLSEWRDDLASYIARELIEAAVDRGVTARPPVPGVRYFAFVDAASGTGQDSFAAGLAHREKDGAVVLDLLHEQKPPFSPEATVAAIAAMIEPYRCREVVGDKWAVGFHDEAWKRARVRYVHSERDRSEIYLDALPLLSSGRVRLLDHPRLVGQFCGLERRTFSTGRDRVDHGRAGHDDACNAAAGALVLAASAPRGLPHISDAVLARSRVPHGAVSAAAFFG